MVRPARLAYVAFAAAAICVPIACGLDAVGSAPLSETTTPNAKDASVVLEDASMGGGDASQGCTDGRTICGDQCTDTTADPANCGGCGKACAVGQTCNAGTCDVLCVGDTIRCAGACIDPSTDPANCGKCGNACGAGLPVCVAKSCEADCKSDQTRCSTDAGAGGALTYCASTMTDRNNCGACGTVCTVNQTCVAGTCKDLCQSPARVGDVFSPTMVGCVDKHTWTNRAQSCPPGTTVCTAAQWNARPAGPKPTFNYWTNDYLEYKGSSSACVAVPQNTGGGGCGGYPMRVCGKKTDPVGNVCNWTNCGFNTVSPNQYYGGCQSNFYAGALCCSP